MTDLKELEVSYHTILRVEDIKESGLPLLQQFEIFIDLWSSVDLAFELTKDQYDSLSTSTKENIEDLITTK